MNIEIGAFEAKSRLSQLLQEVKHGKRFTITVRGRPIADLVPSENADFLDAKTAVENMKNISKIKGVSKETLIDWINEGRK